jgi:hypothetical protein
LPGKNYNQYDNGMHQIQTLGQKWSYKEKNLADYACNIYARQIAALDLLIARLRRLGQPTEPQEILREELVITGTAAFIKGSDILTQLSVRVGRTGSREPQDGSRR